MQRRDSRVRVLQAIRVLFLGGAERVVQHLATKLDPEKFVVDVCATQMGGPLEAELREAGVNVFVAQPVDQEPLKYSMPLRIRRILREGRYDIVHSHGTSPLLDVAPVRLLGTPPVQVHTYHFGNYPYVPKRQLFAERLYSKIPDRLVAVSSVQRELLIEHLGVPAARIETIYNGVSEPPEVPTEARRAEKLSQFGVRPDQHVVGTIAVMSEQKGIPDFLEAVKQLAAKRRDTRFLVVGGGTRFDEYSELCDRMGLSSLVLFTDWRDDALELLSMFDVFVSSSLWEGFAMVILEAMAAARPIVATRVGDNETAIVDGETGLLVDPRDPTGLAKAIDSLLDDPIRAREMGSNGFTRYRRNFTVEHLVRNHEELYLRVLRESKA